MYNLLKKEKIVREKKKERTVIKENKHKRLSVSLYVMSDTL
jgi:DNA-binding transcriptional regulator YhcF (GntR family)